MTEKLKNKINDEQLKIRAISDEKITVKLTNNYAFQKIFKNTKIVKGFPMALLDLKEYEIKKIEITDPFTLGENDEEKEGILDIKLILNQNRKINIEMQNTYQDDWTERSLFYNCRMFTDGLKKGHPYGEIPPCIHVGILNFNQMISPNYYHKFSLMDEKTKEIYSRKFQFHMIELKKLKYVKEKQKKKPLYRWAKLIAEMCIRDRSSKDQHRKIFICFFFFTFTKRFCNDRTSTRTDHKSNCSNTHRNRKDQIDRSKCCFSCKIGNK